MATPQKKPDVLEQIHCPVEGTLRLLSGKWRLLVLFHLESGSVRWGALKRQLKPITPRMLTATLRSLEDDDLIWRRVENTIPPQVAYGLTEKGAGLAPVFNAMGKWGSENLS